MCSAVSTRTTGSTNGGALSGAVRTSAWRACRRSRASGQRCQIAGRVILKPTQLLIWGRSIQRLPGDLVASDHDDRVASSVANGILHLRRLTAAGRNNVMVVRVERGACCRRPIANSSAGTCRGMLFTPHVVAVRSDSNRQANGSAIAPRTSTGPKVRRDHIAERGDVMDDALRQQDARDHRSHRAMAARKLQRNDGQRHLVVESPVAHGGRPEVIWESPLAISRISARIRYRRGQRAVSKMGNKGSLPSRSTY